MPPQDAAWLGMERPTNLMVVTAVLMLDGAPDPAILRALVRERVVDRHPSFRRIPRRTHRIWPRTVWDDDPAHDLAHHLHSTVLAGPVATHLDGFVSDLMSRPLDLRRPPWLMHLVSGSDGNAALVVRVHHCVGDGAALVQVLLSLTAGEADPPCPSSTGQRRPATVRMVGSILRALVRVPLLANEPRTPLRGPLTTRKVVARGAGTDLDPVRARARQQRCTVNDVVLAAVAGGLRELLVDRGIEPVDLRVLVPVDLRGAGAPVPAALGNHFGMVIVALPVGEPDAARRLAEVHRRSLRARTSAEAVAMFVGLTLLGVLPVATQAIAVRLLGARATAVVTNVRGPAGVVALAGRRVDGITFWVPQTGAVGLGVSVLSYAGRISVGVSADARLLTDPAALVRAIEAELCGPLTVGA